MIKILFTGGGTGGHIYPILAVVEEFKEPRPAVGGADQGCSLTEMSGLRPLSNACGRSPATPRLAGGGITAASVKNRESDFEFHYIGAPGRFGPILSENGIFVSKIFSAKFRRYFSGQNFLDFFIFPISVIQAFWKVFRIMPDVLFSKGGPGSLPVVFACWFYRIPIIIHDSDSVIGLANRLAIRFSDRIGISFNSAFEDIIQSTKNADKKEAFRKKIAFIGNPVRQSLVTGVLDKPAAKKKFGFKENMPLILVLGGSQGAAKINDFMMNIAAELAKDFQVLHQTGIDNFKNMSDELNVILKNYGNEEKSRYRIAPYFEDNLKDAYAAADLVISRASSGAIFETAAMGLPAILIPLKEEIVGIHQIKNAYEYAKNGAAVVIEEENLKPNLFLATLEKLLSDREKLKSMSEAAKKFSKPDAAKIIAAEIIEIAGNE